MTTQAPMPKATAHMLADLGKAAYETYCQSIGGAVGEALPSWDEQLDKHPERAAAWISAAVAVIAKAAAL